MFEYLADDFAIFLIQRRIIDAKDRDLYCYGAEVLLLNILNVLIALAVTIFSGTWLHFLIFMFVFVPLRIFAGGYHAKTSRICLIMSTLLYTATVGVIEFIPDFYKNEIALIAAAVIAVFIFIKAPIINKNNVLDRKSFKRSKIISRVLISLDSIIFITLALLKINTATSVMIFIMLIGFLMIKSVIESAVSFNSAA